MRKCRLRQTFAQDGSRLLLANQNLAWAVASIPKLLRQHGAKKTRHAA